ncbi:MAG: helix-turn-helix domain-containing protein, partial [Chlorobium sp.]|nr:helix-turn-helix domain-containing protein [Chlorobium sp.]
MRHYTQLTIEQRYQISGLKKSGFNQSRIATDLNIHKSTISRELKRNIGQPDWQALHDELANDKNKKLSLMLLATQEGMN